MYNYKNFDFIASLFLAKNNTSQQGSKEIKEITYTKLKCYM